MRYMVVMLLTVLSACASNKDIETVTIQKEFAPHIWSDHKVFNGTIEMCSSKGKSILESLGFNHVVKNENYVYGNFSNNRATVKCVSVAGVTFVYAAVAGPEVELVETLRNEIVWQL